jgi:hypothetical protein
MECPVFQQAYTKLGYCDIYCGRAFFPLFYVKGNPVAFIKRLESDCIDYRMMNEYIRTIFLLNEAKAFLVAKPLHDSISHCDILLSNKFSCFQTSGCHF